MWLPANGLGEPPMPTIETGSSFFSVTSPPLAQPIATPQNFDNRIIAPPETPVQEAPAIATGKGFLVDLFA
jgi:hypothetical protein